MTEQQCAILRAIRELEPEAWFRPIIDRVEELLDCRELQNWWQWLTYRRINYYSIGWDAATLERMNLIENCSGSRPGRMYFRLTGRGRLQYVEPEREELPVALRTQHA